MNIGAITADVLPIVYNYDMDTFNTILKYCNTISFRNRLNQLSESLFEYIDKDSIIEEYRNYIYNIVSESTIINIVDPEQIDFYANRISNDVYNEAVLNIDSIIYANEILKLDNEVTAYTIDLYSRCSDISFIEFFCEM